MRIRTLTFLIVLIWTVCSMNPLLDIMNTLLTLNNFTVSSAYNSCLRQQSSDATYQSIEYFVRTGVEASSSSLPKLPHQALQNLKKQLTTSSVACMLGANDLRVLLRSYNTTVDELSAGFADYSSLNFLNVHYRFTNMSLYIGNDSSSMDTQKLAEQLDALACDVYRNSQNQRFEDPWVLAADNVQKMSEYFGISVSNGVIGVVSSNQALKISSTVLAGVYDKIGRGRVDNLIETFPALDMSMSFAGRGLGFYNYLQELYMKQGYMSHSMSSTQCSVVYRYYALRNLPFVFYTEFEVTAHEDGELIFQSNHNAPSQLIIGLKNYENIAGDSILETSALTKTGKILLIAATSFLVKGTNDYTLSHEDYDESSHLLKMFKGMKMGETFKFVVVTCLISSEHHSDPLNQAIRMIIRASKLSALVSGHVGRWHQLWQSDIVIDGNKDDQKSVRTMLYHCYAFVCEGNAYGVSPMGLSGLGYNGHIFWDMDLWIYPAVLALHPSLAKNLVEYRVDRLETARTNAFINGYAGAMYPWESSQSGNEETPVWALSGPLEHHISGCVAFAVWNYFSVTQDKQWLKDKGYQVIRSVAQFFQSRVQIDDKGFYHINNVVAADEWAENVNDDAFTNAVAKVTLEIANKAAELLGLQTNTKWAQIAQKIVILKMQDNVTQQYAGYAGGSIKQADVNLLGYPLNVYTDQAQIKRDLKFYETRVPSHGTPAMTFSIFSLLYSRLKDQENSYKNFKNSFELYTRPPFNVFTEGKGGTNPYFLTGAGGVLQSLIYGFGGLNITDQGITNIETAIPKQWTRVQIKRRDTSRDQQSVSTIVSNEN